MPTYEYECTECGHTFEEFQSMTADPLVQCPECDEAGLRRLIGGGIGVIFKGSGFYVTDSKSSGSRNGSSGKSGDSSESKAGSSGGSSADSAGETKGESKKESPKEASGAKSEAGNSKKSETVASSSSGASAKGKD
jgi:putative FmdB family regulatory protein